MCSARSANGKMAKIKRSQNSPRRPLFPAKPIVRLRNAQKDLKVPAKAMRRAVQELLVFLGVACDEVSLFFVTKRRIQKLHTDFFNDPSPTDCITFPIDPQGPIAASHLLGEVVVCPKVALEYAELHHTQALEEVLLYVIHGLLHLIGYDDQTPSQKKTMRKAEMRCLRYISRSKNDCILAPLFRSC